MQSKYKKREAILVITTLIAIITISIISILKIENQYKEEIYNHTNRMLNIIKEIEPEIEDKIINKMFLANNEKEKSKAENNNLNEDILKKYGITENNISTSKNKIETINKSHYTILTTTIIGLIIIITIFIYYQRKQTKEMKKLDEYCKSIINGNGLLELKEQDEGIEGILKNDIYDMTMMLREKNNILAENNIKTEKLIADISHQLKTPLTSLNLINDLLYDENLPEEKKKEFLDASSKELEKINWLIKTLLNIAKLDSKTIKLKKEYQDAKEMMEEIKNNFKPLCETYNSKINIHIEENTKIYCDKKWTIEAISNIIKNSIEHKGKNIDITVEENQLYSKITIQDDGEGITKKDISHIFERFYKAENSKSESLGLGLAFCKSIIENQNGEIKVQSSKQKDSSHNKKESWTKFEIKLYCERLVNVWDTPFRSQNHKNLEHQ